LTSRKSVATRPDKIRPHAIRFDAAYYRKYYEDGRTAVSAQFEFHARARFIAAYSIYAGLPVRRILDAGCGMGQLRAPLLGALPRASYTGLEVSEYLANRFGWVQGQIDTYKSAKPFDLVVCYDVLQYLDAPQATRAIANLAKLCRGVLYFSALTTEDWRDNCDQARTDPNVHLRIGDWYRERLTKFFIQAGAGMWIRRGAPLVVWEMEKSTPAASARTRKKSRQIGL
jgi:2-polyprenyl-3-methyl-5-hydroxy-6-metoxy-1,4-benzoquinol methylase